MDRFDTFTERARKVLTLAQEEAAHFNHSYIGTEHLLLGLLREGEGVAAKVLHHLGVELDRVRSAVAVSVGRGDHPVAGEIGLAPRAKRAITLAVDESRRLGHHHVGTEHLLLGLLREGEGVAVGILESLGVNLETARTQTIQVLSQSSSSSRSTQTWTTVSHSASSSAPAQFIPEGGTGTRWEYLIAGVVYPEPGSAGQIKRVSRDEYARFAAESTPLHEALEVMGAMGWELVAIAPPAHTGTPIEHSYVLKRCR